MPVTLTVFQAHGGIGRGAALGFNPHVGADGAQVALRLRARGGGHSNGRCQAPGAQIGMQGFGDFFDTGQIAADFVGRRCLVFELLRFARFHVAVEQVDTVDLALRQRADAGLALFLSQGAQGLQHQSQLRGDDEGRNRTQDWSPCRACVDVSTGGAAVCEESMLWGRIPHKKMI